MTTIARRAHDDGPEQLPSDRESGVLLLELMIGVAIILVGLVGTVTATASYLRSYSTARSMDSTAIVFEDIVEKLRDEQFANIHSLYDGVQIPAPNLVDSGGQPAQVTITCFVDETGIPTAFGPLLDLDGDPDTIQVNCSATYQLLPVRLSLTYQPPQGASLTEDLYFVLSED